MMVLITILTKSLILQAMLSASLQNKNKTRIPKPCSNYQAPYASAEIFCLKEPFWLYLMRSPKPQNPKTLFWLWRLDPEGLLGGTGDLVSRL